MTNRVRMLFLVLTPVFGTSGVAMHSEAQPVKSQELIYKDSPMDSGIYNLRRQPMTAPARHSKHRKPRVKPASDNVAALD